MAPLRVEGGRQAGSATSLPLAPVAPVAPLAPLAKDRSMVLIVSFAPWGPLFSCQIAEFFDDLLPYA